MLERGEDRHQLQYHFLLAGGAVVTHVSPETETRPQNHVGLEHTAAAEVLPSLSAPASPLMTVTGLDGLVQN